MAYQIFISYRRYGGEALAYLLHEHLSHMGYKVFYDIESLTHGKFNSKILDVLDECRDVLVLLPPNALDRCVNEDDWLRLEISHALKSGKNIVPVMMRGFEWPESMPEDIAEIKYYNGVVVSFDFFEGVIQRIEKNLMTNTNHFSKVKADGDVKKVLFWGDFDDATQAKIINKLHLDEGYDFELLDYPISLLNRDLSDVYAIVLLVADCTKFSANLTSVDRINSYLVEYVSKGGRLVCAHDVIYRRTKNTALQNAYGCKITNFKQADSVTYKKTDLCRESGLFASLPDEFELHDAEICWGNLAPDVDILFESEEGIPLVFAREYGRGLCVYLNSGDYKETLPRSLMKPEKNFTEILREALTMEYEVD